MTTSEMIEQAIANRGVQKGEVASHMGWSPQNFSNRLRNNSFTSEELRDIALFLGYDMRLVEADGRAVFIEEKPKGIGFKTVQTVNGVMYNTEKCYPVCHSANHGGCFLELYLDVTTFLLVTYVEGEKQSNIMVVSEETARKFYEYCDGTYPNRFFKEQTD